MEVIALLLFVLLYSPDLKAGIYQCEKPDGRIEFRDRPCQTSLDKETFLPISYEHTDPKIVKQQEKELSIEDKKLSKATRLKDRVIKRGEKQKIKEQQKAERRKQRCQRLTEKIKSLEDQLRTGAKIKRFKRLQEELLHCQRMKRRYCSAN